MTPFIGIHLGGSSGTCPLIIEKHLCFHQLLPPFGSPNILVCPQYFWHVYASDSFNGWGSHGYKVLMTSSSQPWHMRNALVISLTVSSSHWLYSKRTHHSWVGWWAKVGQKSQTARMGIWTPNLSTWQPTMLSTPPAPGKCRFHSNTYTATWRRQWPWVSGDWVAWQPWPTCRGLSRMRPTPSLSPRCGYVHWGNRRGDPSPDGQPLSLYNRCQLRPCCWSP